MLIKKINFINLDSIRFYEIKNYHSIESNPKTQVVNQVQVNLKQEINKMNLCQRFEYNQIGKYTVIKDLTQAGKISGFIILKEYSILLSYYQIKFVKDCLFSKDQNICVIISTLSITIYQLEQLELLVNQNINWGSFYKSGAITPDSKYLIINTQENTIILYSLQKLTQIITTQQSKPNFSQIFVSKTNNIMLSMKFGSQYVKRWNIQNDQIKPQTIFFLNHTYTLHYITKHYILVRRSFKTFESMYCIFSNLNKQRKLIRTIKSSFFESLQIDPNCDSNILIDDGNKLLFQTQYKFYCIQTGQFRQASYNCNKLLSKPSIEICQNQLKIDYFELEVKE